MDLDVSPSLSHPGEKKKLPSFGVRPATNRDKRRQRQQEFAIAKPVSPVASI